MKLLTSNDEHEFLRLARKFMYHRHGDDPSYQHGCDACKAINLVEGGRYELSEAYGSLMDEVEVPF